MIAAICLALLVCLLLGAILGARRTFAQPPQEPRPHGYISDFARVISPDTQKAINAICKEVQEKTQTQIDIVTVQSLGGESIERYASELARRWGLGPREQKRGALIFLAAKQRSFAVEFSGGLKSALPKDVLDEVGRHAVPQMQIGNFSGAALLITEHVAAAIAKEKDAKIETLRTQTASPMGAETPPPPLTPRNVAVPLLSVLVLLFFPLLGLLLRQRAARRFGRGHGVWWWGGGAPWYWGGGGWAGGSWGSGGFGGGGGFGGFGGGSFGGGDTGAR